MFTVLKMYKEKYKYSKHVICSQHVRFFQHPPDKDPLLVPLHHQQSKKNVPRIHDHEEGALE